MVARVNGTTFPFVREYAQPTHTTRGRGRVRGRSPQRGAGKGGAPKGSLTATPKRHAADSLEATSQNKRAKPPPPVTNKHADILNRMCERSGLKPEQLLEQFINKHPLPKPS